MFKSTLTALLFAVISLGLAPGEGQGEDPQAEPLLFPCVSTNCTCWCGVFMCGSSQLPYDICFYRCMLNCVCTCN